MGPFISLGGFLLLSLSGFPKGFIIGMSWDFGEFHVYCVSICADGLRHVDRVCLHAERRAYEQSYPSLGDHKATSNLISWSWAKRDLFAPR